jgi:hypothetical protein
MIMVEYFVIDSVTLVKEISYHANILENSKVLHNSDAGDKTLSKVGR